MIGPHIISTLTSPAPRSSSCSLALPKTPNQHLLGKIKLAGMDTASPFGDPDSEIGQPHQAGTSSSRSRRDSINSTTNSSAPNSPPAALAFSGSVAAAGKAQSSKDGHRPGRLGRAWSGTGDGEEDADFSKSRSASAQALGLGLGDATAAASPFRDAHQNAATRADQRGRAEHLDDDMTGSSSRAGPRGATSRGAAREDDDEAPPPSIMLDIDERSPSRRPAGPSGTYARSPPTHSHFSGISSTFANAGKGVRQSTTRGGGSVSVRLEGLRRSREAGVRAARVDEGEQSYSDDMDDGDSDEESRLMGLDGGSEARRSRADGQSSRHGARAAGGFGRLPDLAAGLVKRGARAARDEAADISRGAAVGGLSPRERALWKWANVENVDAFLQEVRVCACQHRSRAGTLADLCLDGNRSMHTTSARVSFASRSHAYSTLCTFGSCIGHIGDFWLMMAALVLFCSTIAFVIGFSTFLLGCVDYSQIRHDGQLSDVIVGHCVSRCAPPLLYLSFTARATDFMMLSLIDFPA